MRLVKAGRLDEAISTFKNGLGTDPQSAVLLNLIGATYSLQGNSEQAEHYLLESLQADSRFESARRNLAISYFNSGKYDLATTEFEKLTSAPGSMSVNVNGKAFAFREEKGYAVLERSWSKGDVVEISFPMEIRKLKARKEVTANRDLFALQRGPIVYCVEGSDNGGEAWDFVLPGETRFSLVQQRILEEPVVALQGDGLKLVPGVDGHSIKVERRRITAIPYYTWANRDNYEMQVWLPMKIDDIKVNA